MRPRSFLYVPANAGERLVRATSRGADALIVDLEDAVAPAERPAARVDVAAWLDSLGEGGPQVWVRINPDEDMEPEED